MTLQDLIEKGSHKVRNDNALMAFYLEEFEKQFGRKPNCAGCTFKNDWNKLVNSTQKNTIQNTVIMKNTFKLKGNENNKIFTYLDGKRPVRTYGYKMTNDFAENYLSKGTKAQIEDRKKQFKTLPTTMKDPGLIITLGAEIIPLENATGKQMNAYAKDNDIDFGDATKVDQKRAVIEKTL